MTGTILQFDAIHRKSRQIETILKYLVNLTRLKINRVRMGGFDSNRVKLTRFSYQSIRLP